MRLKFVAGLAAMLAAPAVAASAQTVTAVLAKYVSARGGKARIAAVQSQRTHAHISIAQATGTITIDQARPGELRMDMMVNGSHYARGYDGTKAWQALIADTGGVQIMPPLDTRNFAIEADFDGPLVDPASGGTKVALVGRAMVDGRNTYKVQAVLAGGGGYVDYYYLDPATYLPVVWEGTRLVNGQTLTFTTHFRTYRTFSGLQFPVRVETTTNGTPPQITIIDGVDINPKIDPAEFKPPVFAKRPAP
ncbi:MAG: hypothetical protein M3R65_07520 [Gemmatimonadota bacterium]|nr:hypothetical protein [Gemmatimonadota bacterium]